ncbi:MAG TPA: tRNA (adenosine(37)-N6)-dimethylallyltransferase MiaA, partial [Pseudolabrys sp.]|nr:tRNA (adenosine(37)-N6)-dimethylallyltransferase MiaA [Pseudolabrys sp.]
MLLLNGIGGTPMVPGEIRAQVRARLQNDGVAPLYAELIERDPVTAARLMPLDRVRIARA